MYSKTYHVSPRTWWFTGGSLTDQLLARVCEMLVYIRNVYTGCFVVGKEGLLNYTFSKALKRLVY